MSLSKRKRQGDVARYRQLGRLLEQEVRARVATQRLKAADAHHVIDPMSELRPCLDPIEQAQSGGEHP